MIPEQIIETINCRKEKTIQEKIATIDWSFAHREQALAIEAIHPYPAKFIGNIPRVLMEILPLQKNTIVFDPFNGSGTTLLEAQRRGIASVGVDINPIACLISRVKTSHTPISLLDTVRKISIAARKNKKPFRWDIPNVDHWFKAEIQQSIAAILQEIHNLEDSNLYDALRLALSSILVRISNQDSDTRYAAVDKQISGEDVFDNFENAAEKLNKALIGRDWDLVPAKVIEANTLTMATSSLGGRIGLIITSPPYPNAYEYWLYHKYRMFWLGFDPLAVKEQEIGARAHFFKRDHHTEQNFWDQMRSTFKLIDNVLVKHGYACFVIGRSKIHNHIVNNADIIQAISDEHSFNLISRFDRVISSSRKSFNLSHANIKTETVLVLQKTKA